MFLHRIAHDDFKTKIFTWNKGHCVMARGSIHQEAITIINVHKLNNRASKWRKADLIEGGNRQFNNSGRLQLPK